MNTPEADTQSDILSLAISGLYQSDDIESLRAWGTNVHLEITEMSKRLNKKIKVLIDLRALDGYTDPQVLIVLAELMKSNDPYVLRTATFGGKMEHEMAEEMIKMYALRTNLKNFKTEEEARVWLNS
jgi:hypothetical protein